MAKFSSPPAGPLAAGLERDFCRCRLEVLHLFENFTRKYGPDDGEELAPWGSSKFDATTHRDEHRLYEREIISYRGRLQVRWSVRDAWSAWEALSEGEVAASLDGATTEMSARATSRAPLLSVPTSDTSRHHHRVPLTNNAESLSAIPFCRRAWRPRGSRRVAAWKRRWRLRASTMSSDNPASAAGWVAIVLDRLVESVEKHFVGVGGVGLIKNLCLHDGDYTRSNMTRDYPS